MRIELDTIWTNKKTGQKVLVIWASKALVTYIAEGAEIPNPVRKMIFLQDFEVSND